MSNTLILPDHISFEEIATKWCRRAYRTIRFSRAFYELVSYENDCRHDIIAIIFPDKRTFIYPPDSQEKLQPILDFIKERSNSNNEITIPDHISLERIATIWCHKDLRNSVLHSGRSWVFVQFNDDSYKIAAESSSNSSTLKFYPEFVPSASAFLDDVVSFIEGSSNGQN